MTVITPPPTTTIDPLVSGGGSEPHKSRGVFHDVWVARRWPELCEALGAR